MENRIAPSSLKVPRHRRGTSTKLSGADQHAALGQIVDAKSLSARDRAAAMLVLVFGQHSRTSSR
jgi:hypothetical protein